MADREVLREFLVSLGFQIQDQEQKKFDGAIDRSTKNVEALAKGLTVAAIATAEAVKTFVAQMERLYYASQRTGAAVSNIQALEYGAKQVGVAGEAARASLEGMARAIRQNPGMRGYLDSLVGKKTDGMDQMQSFMLLLEKFKSEPFYLASRQAGMFGIDSDTLFMLLQNLDKLKQAEAERLEMQKRTGVSSEDQAKQAAELARQWAKIAATMEVFSSMVMRDLLPAAKQLGEWAQQFGDKLVDLDRKTDGWSTRLVAVLGTLTAIKALFSASKALRRLLFGVPAEEVAVAAPGVAAKVLGGTGAMASAGAGVGAMLYSSDLNPGEDQALMDRQGWNKPGGRVYSGKIGDASPVADQPLGLRHNNPGNLMPGGKIATYGSMTEGLQRMALLLRKYMARGQDSIRKIIAGTGRGDAYSATDQESYIRTVSRLLGMGENDRMDGRDPQQVARLMGAMIQVEQVRNPFSNAQLLGAAGASGMVINQTTNISVSGGGGNETARAISQEQRGVNAEMARNFAGAVR